MPARARKRVTEAATAAERGAPRQRGVRQRAEVLQALRAIVGMLHRSARSVEQRTGLTNAQLFILQQLREAEPRSINELAGMVMTQQSTVSLVVSRLEARGLVRRARAADDARRVEVTLSPAGRRLLRAAPETPVAHILAGLDQLTPASIAKLHRGLRDFSEALGIEGTADALLFEDAAAAAATRRPRRPSPARGSARRPS